MTMPAASAEFVEADMSIDNQAGTVCRSRFRKGLPASKCAVIVAALAACTLGTLALVGMATRETVAGGWEAAAGGNVSAHLEATAAGTKVEMVSHQSINKAGLVREVESSIGFTYI